MRGARVSAADFQALFDALSNWGRWRPDDEHWAILAVPDHRTGQMRHRIASNDREAGERLAVR